MTLGRKSGLKPFSDKRLAKFGGRAPQSTLDKPGGEKVASSPKRTSSPTDPDQATVDAVMRRSGGKCESCGDELYGRRGFEYSIHHRKRRSQGGDNRTSNLVVLCGHGTSQCHGACHSEIARARQAGLLLRSRESPQAVPMERHDGTVLLDDDGTFTVIQAITVEEPYVDPF